MQAQGDFQKKIGHHHENSSDNRTHPTISRRRAVGGGQATSDGAGVKLTRVLTQPYQYRLDPFLMLDAFGSDNPDEYIAGFPDHPHRGFETITYMLEGRMRHRDSAGNEGLLENGGVQWMTAGRGVIHSELPEQEAGRMEGFQLWLNLAAKDKMSPAWYRDFKNHEIPEIETEQRCAGTHYCRPKPWCCGCYESYHYRADLSRRTHASGLAVQSSPHRQTSMPLFMCIAAK